MEKVRFAIDLGTTMIDACLVSVESGNIIGSGSIKNSQSLYGRDLIGRIYTATRDFTYVNTMKDMVVQDIISLFSSMSSNYQIDKENVSEVCICGNTTMISILLGYDISTLGVYPFEKKLDKSVILNSNCLFEDFFSNDCRLFLSGCVSAFIGGDILSGILSLQEYDFCDNNKTSILIDLGTNGEMVLNSRGSFFGTSAACGPAFESGLKKKNTYGTTLVDAIALGLRAGIISAQGSLNEKYHDDGLKIHDVILTQELIHDILLAKTAIYTGIESLLNIAGIKACEVEHIYIAGGMGTYLNIENTIYIGMLPQEFKDRISVVGNSSLKGACKIHIGKDNQIDKLIEKLNIHVLKLAGTKDYEERLINNMYFVRK